MHSPRSSIFRLSLAVAAVTLFSGWAHAGTGDLDPDFGDAGAVFTGFNDHLGGATGDVAYAMARQSDGKVVVAGSSHSSAAFGSYFGLARYDESGLLDPEFNGTGTVRIPAVYGARAIAIQSDGRIVAAGPDLLARLLPNGTLDPGFGTDGIVATADPEFETGLAVEILPDGRILVAGKRKVYLYGASDTKLYLYDGFAVACHLPDGSLDDGFGTNGRASLDLGANSRARAMAIDSQGRIILAGYRRADVGDDVALARFLPNGSPDPGFDTNGWTTVSLGQTDKAGAVAIVPGDKILAGCITGENAALVRLLPDGTPDPGFGSNGKAVTNLAVGDAYENDSIGMAVHSDGSIVMGGSSNANSSPLRFAVARFHSNGTLDPSFNGTGYATALLGSGSAAHSVGIQADGGILLAGAASPTQGSDFALARLLADGPGIRMIPGSGPLPFSDAWVGEATVKRTITIASEGSTALDSLAIGIDGPGAASFQVISEIPASIEPGESADIELGFAPQEAGSIAATLLLSSNDPTRSPVSVGLIGTGKTRPRFVLEMPDGTELEASNDHLGGLIDFGASPAGVPIDLTLTIRNPGAADLTGLAATASGDFTIISAPVAPVPPGGSTNLTVRFNPSSHGPKTRSLIIPNNATSYYIRMIGTGIAPALVVEDPDGDAIGGGGEAIEFGSLLAGSQAILPFTINNHGSADLVISSLSLEGADAGAFQLTPPAATTLLPGESAGFSITLRAALPGQLTGTVDLVTNDPARSPLSFLVRGTVNSPRLEVVDGRYESLSSGTGTSRFEPVLPGISSDQSFVLVNQGDADLAIESIKITGPDAGNFTIIDAPSGPIQAHSVESFTIRFNAPAPGLKSAVLETTSNDPFSNPFLVNLKAVALESEVHGNGRPDESFGSGGSALARLPGMEPDYDLAIQADGKIVVAGTLYQLGSSDFLVARFMPDGSPDVDFNDGLPVPIDFGGYDAGRSVAVLSDGKIVIAGNSEGGFALARLLPGGSLDPSFGVEGKVVDPVEGVWGDPNDMLIDAEGRILLAGRGFTEEGYGIAVARYLVDGEPDNGFNGNGRRVFNLESGDYGELARGVALQPDGRIVISGESQDRIFVARMLEDGALDTTFNDDGWFAYEAALWSSGGVLEIQQDGKIVVGGSFSDVDASGFLVMRFLTDGSLDADFGENGVAAPDLGVQSANCSGVTIQADGKIVLVGTTNDLLWTPRITLAKLLPGGAVDTEYGREGVVTGESSRYIAGALEGNEDIIVAFYTGGGLGLQRLLSGLPAGGTFDLSPSSAVRAGDPMSGHFAGWSQGASILTYQILVDDVAVAPESGDQNVMFSAPLQAGLHQVKGRIIDGSGRTTEVVRSLRVLLTGEQWRELHFADVPDEGGDSNDPDSDGRDNLLEFATGSDPRTGTRIPEELQLMEDQLVFAYHRDKAALLDGVTFRVEWSDNPSAAPWSTNEIHESISDLGDSERVSATLPAGTSGRRFVRLRVDRD